jgi:integrase
MAKVRKRTWTNSKGGQEAWIADYRDQAGERHIKTFNTKREASAWLVTAQGEVARGVHTPENASITVAAAAEIWIERGELENLERSTLRQYRNHVALHIKPSRIGNEKLARLSTPMIEAFRDDLLRKVSRPMARKALASLKSILGEAQRRGLVAHNAAQPVRVDLKKREQGKLAIGRDIPSKDEINAILAQAEGRWRPFFVTAVFTGMRASELRGLIWDDVDDKRNNSIHVRQRANLWGEIGAPKSAAGDRDIPMSPMVVNVLETCLPKGEARACFPERQWQRRESREHRQPRLVRAPDRGRAHGSRRRQVRAARAPAFLRIMGDRAGLLAEAAPSTLGSFLDPDDLRSLWPFVSQPRRRSRQIRRRRARLGGLNGSATKSGLFCDMTCRFHQKIWVFLRIVTD